MTDRYPDHATYRALYLRYFDGRSVQELLRLLEPIDGMRVLDLCAGEGQLALAALEAGAREAAVVDAEPAMVSSALSQRTDLRTITTSVHVALSAMCAAGGSFDRVACRQAVNYWLDERTADLLADLLTPRGIFAFNTFNQRPPERPRVLEYEMDGHAFVEVSWLVGDAVHHLQARDGMAPHHTAFAWLPPERLHELLRPRFAITEERHGKTSLYRCEKK